MLSTILGGVVNKALGKPTDAGMASSLYSIRWNSEAGIIEEASLEEAIRSVDAAVKIELDNSQYNDMTINAGPYDPKKLAKISDNLSYVLSLLGNAYYTASVMYQHALHGAGRKAIFPCRYSCIESIAK